MIKILSGEKGILSDYELEVFKLVNEGESPDKIAESINSNDELNYKEDKDKNKIPVERSPANIRKTKVVVRSKLERELQKIATANRLDLDLAKIPKDTGIMIAFDWVHNTKVYLFFTAERGIIAWWEHLCSERCESLCQETLALILKERNIDLPPNDKNQSILEQFRKAISIIQVKGEKKE
jgi:hypothetical protein